MPSLSSRNAITLGLGLGLTVLALFNHAPNASADVVVETRTASRAIVIPQFNTALGTLTAVDLTVSLLPSQTSANGQHVHPATYALSTNTLLAFDPDSISLIGSPARLSSTRGLTSETATTPSFSNSQIDLGSFTATTLASGSHNHTVQLSVDTLQQLTFGGPGPYEFRVRLLIQPDNNVSFNHVHQTVGQTKTYTYDTDFDAFLNPDDQSIAAPTLTFPASGSHSHSITGLDQVYFNTDRSTQIAAFANAALSATGSHTHTISPVFTTTATFTYTPIPEPTTAGLLLATTALLITRRRRAA